ncbi:preprotein translocase subunit SecG [Haloferax prahovense DSM 18310]|uniref:Preprotein translocase subunit SecG n=1 Tax=Haloferax prahovense (strain DSM 18310 / JCM 13924 / TL6) TaxID=1227461 RepID=M0GMG8_HALPT|nr:preprotein translocase subunit SecG [Haloferax prahovense DSM 18310]
MSKGQNSGGLMSSAGLVRYFDAEDRNAIPVSYTHL